MTTFYEKNNGKILIPQFWYQSCWFFCQITNTWVLLYSSHFFKDERFYEAKIPLPCYQKKKIPLPILKGNKLNINSYIYIFSFPLLIFCSLFFFSFFCSIKRLPIELHAACLSLHFSLNDFDQIIYLSVHLKILFGYLLALISYMHGNKCF